MRNENMNMTYKRGDVFLANFPAIEGSSIQSGVRPIIITSNEMALNYSPVIHGIPVTSKVSNKKEIPVHVKLNNDLFLRPSMALAEQEGLIDKTRLMKKIGTLSEEEMLNIDVAILMQRTMNKKYLYKIAKTLACA